jgi:hypothetical protein
MLIWKGHGILILVFGVIGGLVCGFLTAGVYAATHWSWMPRLIVAANFWGAAAAIWLYAKTMGKTVQQTYLDPATHRPVVIRTSHSLFFIPPVPWAILATLLAGWMTVMSFTMPAEHFMDAAGSSAASPGKGAFEEANGLIAMDKGQEAYGNTPEAEKLAAAFSAMVKLGRQMGIQAGKKSTISLSKGKFLTYCRINADSCAFMVHVPDLRKFSQEAKEYIADMAWAVAMKSASQLQPQPKRLAVGIRGAFLYDTVIEGHLVAEDKDSEEGIEQRHPGGSPEKYLAAFFESNAGNADLPKLGPVDESEKRTASSSPQMAKPSDTPGRADVDAAVNPSQKVKLLLKWFPTTKPGEVAGNADAANQLALKYASFVHDRVTDHPVLGGMALPEPCFSAYVHLRDDTVAFLLALPAGTDLPPDLFKVVENEACVVAAMAAAQMSPLPARIAIITFNEGQMNLTRIGSSRNPEGTEWIIEQELPGRQGGDVLAPFVAASFKPLITVKSPLTLQKSVKTVLAKSRHVVRAPAPAPSAPTAARAPAPLLPTPMRDWKDATGRVMQASLESFTSPTKDAGRFKRADGQAFEVPFARLSAEDQEFIRGLVAQK